MRGVSSLSMQYLPILIFAGIYVAMGVSAYVGVGYLVASLICFSVYAFDKAAARSGERRTPERTLLLLGLAGGWPGAVLAQQWLRHKSAKTSFRLKFWATVAVNAGLFVYLGQRM